MSADTINNADESLDNLILGGMKLIQSRQGYRFSLDAVLLAHFPALKNVHHVLDLGTGNGIIPLILAYRARDVQITGLEIQPAMVARAKRNIILNHMQTQIKIISGDIKTLPELLPAQSYELVVSNPPFYKINEGHISKDEEQSIARHELAVSLPELVSQAGYVLKNGGCLTMIHRVERFLEIIELVRQNSFIPKRIRMIYSRVDEQAKLFLIEAQKQGKGQLDVLPPFIIYDQGGRYSQELRTYYKS